MLQLTHTRMSLPRYVLVKALARMPVPMPLYHRIDDPLIAGYIASGVHEPDHVQLFSACAANGYNGYLLDIGANIGLSSLQSSAGFAELHCVEPNPIVFEVLRANCGLVGRSNAHFFYNFGLGRSDGSAILRIPKNNWGGAFVAEETAYDEKTLALKDRFTSYDPGNYRDETIVIRKASGFFQEFFAAHAAVKGVVKIDVEGLEETLLEEIAPFCASGNVVIFFENWSPTFDVGAFFRGRFPALTLSKIESNLDGKSRLLRVLTHVTLGRRGWLTSDFGDRFAGDFVGVPVGLFESLRSFRR